jgi:O-antigen ligase
LNKYLKKLLDYIREKCFLESIILLSMPVIYTGYAILFSNAKFAKGLLILFFIFSMILLYKSFLPKLIYFKSMGYFILGYILMSYLSVIIGTQYADISYLNKKIIYIVMASFIPIGFYKIQNFNFNFFKSMLTLLLIGSAIFIIMLNKNIIDINNVEIFNLVMKRIPWTQKNYMFWYSILMFGTLSFYNIRKKVDFIMITCIVCISYITIFGGYSDSVRVSFIVGILVYYMLATFEIKKKYLLVAIWLFSLYVVFSPVLFSLIDLTSYHHKLIARDAIYHTAAALIKEHFIFGYGYGSTLTLNLTNIVDIYSLPKNYINVFPGGHPHNLALLFWLEFGIFGAIFLAYFIHKMLAFVTINTSSGGNQSGLLAMIVNFEILTSFSWSIWYPQVLLTFSFFGIMLMLSMNIKRGK